MATFTYIPASAPRPGLLNTRRTRTVRVAGSTCRQNLIDASAEVTSGIGVDRDLRPRRLASSGQRHSETHWHTPTRWKDRPMVLELRFRLHVCIRQSSRSVMYPEAGESIAMFALYLALWSRSAIVWAEHRIGASALCGLEQPPAARVQPCHAYPARMRFRVCFGKQVFLLAAH